MGKIKSGDIFESKKYGKFKILNADEQNNKYTVEFLSTKYTDTVSKQSILRGCLRDYFMPDVYGAGFLGCKNPDVKKNKKVYDIWRNMLQRCFDSKYQSICPTYKNVTCCDRWLNFSLFKEDVKLLENYDKWISDNSQIYAFDKDKKQQGVKNKIYDINNCCFITASENTKLSNESHNLYEAIDPKGNVYTFTNQRLFAIEHGLTRRQISAVVIGEQKTHKGWKFKKIA